MLCVTCTTSGIPGGYRLVSTYDLPDFPKCGGGGYFGVNFGHLKYEVFRNGGGGYFGVNFGHLKYEVFRHGGWGVVFRSKLWSSEIWSFPKWGGGVFRSKLWSSQIWSFPKWRGGGGGFLVWNSRKGLSGKFGQKFTVWGMCTGMCYASRITDSLSHTTYVETNKTLLVSSGCEVQ